MMRWRVKREGILIRRFVAIYKNAIEQTRKMLQTDGEVFVVAGSGTIAMEMALVNTVAAGEKILVVSQGYFGDRFIKLGQAFGIEVDVLQSEWGKQVTPEEVEVKLAEGHYKAVTITHADTSTGVAADLDALVPIVKKHWSTCHFGWCLCNGRDGRRHE